MGVVFMFFLYLIFFDVFYKVCIFFFVLLFFLFCKIKIFDMIYLIYNLFVFYLGFGLFGY